MSELGYIEKKVVAGEELTEQEMRHLVYYGDYVDEIEGAEGRWQREIQTIIEINDELYAIDWQRGLTEYQKDVFLAQPYKVKRVRVCGSGTGGTGKWQKLQ